MPTIGAIVSALGAVAVATSLGIFSYRSLDLLEQADFRAKQLSSPAMPPPPEPPPRPPSPPSLPPPTALPHPPPASSPSPPPSVASSPPPVASSSPPPSPPTASSSSPSPPPPSPPPPSPSPPPPSPPPQVVSECCSLCNNGDGDFGGVACDTGLTDVIDRNGTVPAHGTCGAQINHCTSYANCSLGYGRAAACEFIGSVQDTTIGNCSACWATG